MLPPDFTTFWTQANQKGFKPKAVSVGKAILFPVALEALGKTGNNLSSEVWWSPTHPFKSSLNGQSAAELAAGFTAATGRQWTQPIGFIHSLFEFAVDTLKRAADPTDPAAIVESIAKVDLQTITGPIKFGQENVPPFARANLSQDAAGRRPVEAQGRRQVRHRRRRQPDRAGDSGRRQDGADRLIVAAGRGRSGAPPALISDAEREDDMALTTQTMTDEQRKSVAIEYLKAFDNGGVTSTGGSILDLFADDAQVYFPKWGLANGKEQIGQCFGDVGGDAEVDRPPLFALQLDLLGQRRRRLRGHQPWRAQGRPMARRRAGMAGRPLVRRVRDPRLEDPALLHLSRPRLRRQGHRPLSLDRDEK